MAMAIAIVGALAFTLGACKPEPEPELGPLTATRWLTILQGIEANSSFDGTLDLSHYTRSDSASGSGLRSDGVFDPDNNIAIGKGKIVSIILPNTAIEIAGGTATAPTFRHFTNLKTFNGATLSIIGDYAFAGSTSLTITTLPAWLTSIGNNAFQGCISLTEITLPAGLSSIGNSTFQGCTSLTLVTSPMAAPPALGVNAFDDTHPYMEIRVPEANVTAYWEAAGWSSYAYIIDVIPPDHFITINTQPAEVSNFALGSINGILSVTASVTPDTALSYQWYTFSNDDWTTTAISGATSESYTIPTDLTAGRYYYFCEVSVTESVSVQSNVAAVNVYIITINTQPAAMTTVAQGSISGSLSVTATFIPDTTLSYQWYSNTSNSNTGGTAISGATSASYTIPTDLTEGTTYYYFCEVSAVGATSVRSNVALVSVVIISATGIEMVWVPAGTFTMGINDLGTSPPTVTLTSGFHMGIYQVTQEQYQAVMGSNPSYFHGGSGREPASGEVQGRRPVETVSWYDAIVFCNRLSILEGLSPAYSINDSTNPDVWGSVPYYDWYNDLFVGDTAPWDAVTIVSGSTGYRLPTEAQWEYTCRAGSTTAYYWGNQTDAATIGQYAWHSGNSNSRTHEVEKKQPNAWGLYDMSGNVWEWCWDWYDDYPSGNQTDPVGASSGSLRVFRGGYWSGSVEYLQSALRYDYDPINRLSNIGFRVLRP